MELRLLTLLSCIAALWGSMGVGNAVLQRGSNKSSLSARILAHLQPRALEREEALEIVSESLSSKLASLLALRSRATSVGGALLERLVADLSLMNSSLTPQLFLQECLEKGAWATLFFGSSTYVFYGKLRFAILLCITIFPLPGIFMIFRAVALARHRRRLLDAALPSLLERLSLFCSSGLSINSAIEGSARQMSGVWKGEVALLAMSIRRGESLTAALEISSRRVGLASYRRLTRLLGANAVNSELPGLLTSELKLSHEARRNELIERLEKRSQSVWIPVSVATLLPGSIFLFIPFFAALRLLTGL